MATTICPQQVEPPQQEAFRAAHFSSDLGTILEHQRRRQTVNGSRSSEGSESFKDHKRGRGEGEPGAKGLLKAAYKEIGALEQNLTEMHRKMAADPEAGISVLLDRTTTADRSLRQLDPKTADTQAAWAELVSMHKKLANLHHDFLNFALDPTGPAGLRGLPVKYNIPVRLWQTGFHLILERLRFAWMSHNPAALDLLTDFIYDAYQFYTELLEDQTLSSFRTAWIEALGDLARYRMAVASTVTAELPKEKRSGDARIDDDEPAISSGASIGQEVADNWDVEDKETWRTTARDWYAMGITEKPGEGRLHHHLALLCRDMRGQEGRALYHFVKSLTASHPFETSRESILPLFDSALQFQRSTPEATAMDLFIRLHGMLFTKIQLDDFPEVMSRFMERLEEDAELDGVSRKACVTQVDWLLMGTVNLGAIMQYGSDQSIIRKALAREGAARRKQQILEDPAEGDDDADGGVVDDEEPLLAPPSDDELPASFTLAVELAFSILEFVFTHPFRQQGMYHVLNPYLTIMLTFIATIFRQPVVSAPLLTRVPWQQLANFVNSLDVEVRAEARLIGPAALPGDWTMRGMEWIGRRVYERGFWKAKPSVRGSSGGPAVPRIGERFQSEMDVLLANFDSALDITEGVVDDVDGADLTDGPVAIDDRRRRRVAWAAGVLATYVDGFDLEDGKVVINPPLSTVIEEAALAKAADAAEAERVKAQRRAARCNRSHADDPEPADSESEGDDHDPELAVLRDRRRHLRDVLKVTSTHITKAPRSKHGRGHNVVPGYTILIFDTNVLLSSLSLFAKVVEGGQWSVIVPLPVVTELDGLSKNPPPLGAEAKAAVSYLEARIRTHALCLKIQTSRGNYLTDLLIRAEHLDFRAPAPGANLSFNERARTMDDLILNVASFQAEHFVDRSALLGSTAPHDGATQVLLVTFDRNLRLKARARGVEAADEKEMAAILGRGE
ncbi:hypothetical protein Q8F55_009006 [Vanrija albida]|uniref:PIN domain-containing protein n=1 Tax=Vanrija albida TaxID=181172 RepID=A0ABR3PSE3_9TREE